MAKEKLFVAGLLNSNFHEVYYIIDLEEKKSKEIEIDNTKEQEKLLDMIKKQFPDGNLPYGAMEAGQFIPYLINPHSCYKVGNKMLSFMLQAPYFRKIDLTSFQSEKITYTWCNEFTDVIFSASTIGTTPDQSVYLTVNSSHERADIYNGVKLEMGFDIVKYDVMRSKFEKCKQIEKGLIDNMHQVGYSKNGFLVSLDMNISVNINVNDMADLRDENAQIEYNNAYFPKGKVFIWDMIHNVLKVIVPPLCTPAHVEFDLKDQTIFYVSCHNMSKFKAGMVLHGPGMIVKYQYKNGQIKELEQFTDEDFNRITTHKLFYCNDKAFLAVTGYPNYLYIIEAATMTCIRKIRLFEAEIPVSYSNGLFPCIKNKNAPLYLQVNKEGTEVFLVNNNTCFSVQWLESKVRSFEYTKNDFAVSAHIEIF